jgi:hypothetical protein
MHQISWVEWALVNKPIAFKMRGAKRQNLAWSVLQFHDFKRFGVISKD